MSADRAQISAEDMAKPDSFRRALNSILLSIQEDLDTLGKIHLPADFDVQTTAVGTGYGQPPFPIRVALPEGVTPGAVLLGGLTNLSASGAPAVVAQDVKWVVKPGGGGILVQHIPGLSMSSKYRVRLVVIRA